MREHVINEVRKLKEKENDFKGQEWKDIYFATDTQNLHISEINYEELNDEDLLRFLVFLIMGWDGAIERRLRATLSVRVYDRELELDDDIMTVKDWQDAVEAGYFINEDSSGYWVKDGLACRDEVFNSEPLDATHMVWYNK